MFLPFALWDSLNWLTIPVTVGTSAIFFCIEEVGVLIENPFPILALDVIAQSARNNVTVRPLQFFVGSVKRASEISTFLTEIVSSTLGLASFYPSLP